MERTVLLVDDDASFRGTVRAALEEQGVTVKEVADGEEAIEEVERALPHLMLLDLLMPKRDGYAVLHFLREHSIEVPVVILSGLSDSLDREKCKKLGARAYIVKGDIDVEELWPMVQKYLS